MFRDQKTYLLFLNFSSDLICLSALYYLILPLFLSNSDTFFSFIEGSILKNHLLSTHSFILFYPSIILIPLAVMKIFQINDKIVLRNIQMIFYQSIILCITAAGVLFIFSLVIDFNLKISAYFSIISGSLLFPMLVLNRIYILHIIKKGSANNNLVKHLLLAGTGPNAQSILRYIEDHPECGLRVTGFMTNKDSEIDKKIFNKKIVGKIDNLITLVQKYYTDCVVYTGDSGYSEYHANLLKSCSVMGIDFATTELTLHNNIIQNESVFSENIGDIELKLVKFIYINSRDLFLKRVFDFTVSLFLIVVLLPLLITIAILIKLTSKGPVFFQQERLGKYGRKFFLLKFRSMVADAEQMQEQLMHLNEMDGPAFKIKNDPRLTKVGSFLRKLSLDELPQLFNVLRGDISLVGPRPAIEDEVLQYRPIDRKRLAVIQGITCIWQISGRNTIKFDEWMKLDLMYIENWSRMLDFEILFKTLPAVFLKKGAY